MALYNVVIHVDQEVSNWKLGQYLGEILEIPQTDRYMYNIIGLHSVERIGAAADSDCICGEVIDGEQEESQAPQGG